MMPAKGVRTAHKLNTMHGTNFCGLIESLRFCSYYTSQWAGILIECDREAIVFLGAVIPSNVRKLASLRAYGGVGQCRRLKYQR